MRFSALVLLGAIGCGGELRFGHGALHRDGGWEGPAEGAERLDIGVLDSVVVSSSGDSGAGGGSVAADAAVTEDAALTAEADSAIPADASMSTDAEPATDLSLPGDTHDAPAVDARPADRGTQPLVVVTDNLKDEGRDCFRIQTPAATYWYDKQGAGFTSLVDPEGNDWIGWHPGGGSAGEYRGIPNLGHCCHPGNDSATSTLVADNGTYAKIRSTGTGKDGARFEMFWEFWPDHATLTVVAAPSQYYMLYEGTPGGALDSNDSYVTSAGASTRQELLQGGELITSDLAGPEWIYFEDAGLGRALLLVHHEDDAIGERYWTMNAEMTVFGFGRTGRGASMGMTAAPQHLSIAFVEQVSFAKASQLASALMR